MKIVFKETFIPDSFYEYAPPLEAICQRNNLYRTLGLVTAARPTEVNNG